MKEYPPVTPLSRKRLDELLAYFDGVEHINEFHYLGKIKKSSNDRPNPFYMNYHNSDTERILTATINLNIPSPKRYDKNGAPIVSPLSIFTTGKYAEMCNATLDTGTVMYIVGYGNIHNCRILDQTRYNPELVDLVRDIVFEAGKGDSEFKSIFKALHMSYDKNDSQSIPFTHIWSNNMADGNEIAQSLKEGGHLPQINKVKIQGILFMPPSIRHNSRRYILHFKLLVKRKMEYPNQPVPEYFQAKHDYINVLCFGEYAEQWFNRLKGLQGHPIRVLGRLEQGNYHYSQHLKQEKIINLLSSTLNCTPDHVFVKEIIKFLKENNLMNDSKIPAYNVWAEEISTRI